jgi:hypothetical protein
MAQIASISTTGWEKNTMKRINKTEQIARISTTAWGKNAMNWINEAD